MATINTPPSNSNIINTPRGKWWLIATILITIILYAIAMNINSHILCYTMGILTAIVWFICTAVIWFDPK